MNVLYAIINPILFLEPSITMKLFTSLIFLCGLILIQACNSKSPPKSKIENPIAGQTKALEKAKDLERQLNEAGEKQRKAINRMSQ